MSSFIVLVTDQHGDHRAFGPYRSFKKADNDARMWNNAVTLPVENPDTRWINRPEVFTPLNADQTARLQYKCAELKILSGDPFNQTGPGLHGVIELPTGEQFEVHGVDCGADCYCDAYLKPILSSFVKPL